MLTPESEYKCAKIVAEVGCTHIGDMNRAKELIKLAHLAGADYVKFQKRNPIDCVPKEIQNLPHPNQVFSYGKTYLEHRQNLELSIGQHCELNNYCNQIGIKYSTSVWDITSAKEIISYINPEFIKIPSPCNNNEELLNIIALGYEGDIHISTGMTTSDEFDSLLNTFVNIYKCPQRVVLYHCTSEYPCKFEHLYLLEIQKLKQIANGFGFRIGFSNHGYGLASDICAYMLGAEWIERHFIDDRTFRHTDASASLEPDGLRRLCRDLKNIRLALTFKEKLSTLELEQREKLKYRKCLK